MALKGVEPDRRVEGDQPGFLAGVVGEETRSNQWPAQGGGCVRTALVCRPGGAGGTGGVGNQLCQPAAAAAAPAAPVASLQLSQ